MKIKYSIISLVLYGSVARRVIILDKEDFFKRRLEELRHRLNLLGSKKVFLEDSSWYWDLKPDLLAGEVFEL